MKHLFITPLRITNDCESIHKTAYELSRLDFNEKFDVIKVE